MIALAFGTATFLAGLVLHLFIWRVRVPAGTTRALALCLLGGMLAFVAGCALAGLHFPPARALFPDSLLQFAQAMLLALSLACAYYTSYPAVEVESPSLVIASIVAARGERGISRAELLEIFNDSAVVTPRIRDLLSDGMAEMCGDRLKATAKGAALGRAFTRWRALLGLGIGG